MKYRLQDLIDIKHFQDLQDRLDKIYSFPSSILDNAGNILTATAWQDVCTKFHRKNKETEKLCIKSDKYIKEHIHEASPAVSYRCPHGLVDNAIPIIIDDLHYGNFFIGQFFLEKPDLDFFSIQADKYGFEKEEYLEAVQRVPIWDQKQLDNYLHFIDGLIKVISESGLKRLKEIEARKEIQKREERHKSIMQTAMDGFWLTDTMGNITEVNKAYCDMSGYSETELLSMHISDLDALESIENVKKRIKKIIQDGSNRFESRHRCKDGTFFEVEVSTQYRDTDEGQFVCFLRDITQRKEYENNLKISHERFLKVLNSIDATIYVADMDTYEIIFMNKHMMKSFSGGKIGEKCYEVFRNENKPCKHCTNELLIDESGRPLEVVVWEGENPITQKIYINHDRAIDWPDGRIVKLQVATDITDFQLMERQLIQAQKLESIANLSGGIAHDFNNILFPIIGMSEMLMEDLPKDSEQYDNVEEILKAGKRGSDLVKQILTFSRQSEQKTKPLRVQQILKEVLKLSRSTVPTSIEIVQDIQQNCGLVMANGTQIHQIAMNLITNAYHAITGDNGKIVAELKEMKINKGDLAESRLDSGHYVRLSVTDNGVGIEHSNIKKIFEPYFTTKEKDKGTGLGLAVVYGIVKDHNGDIKVYSEPGKGTTVNVYLPLMNKVPKDISVVKDLSLPKGNERILLVDDEIPILKLEKQILERLGYKVTECSSSIEALHAFKIKPKFFDMVITDMTMPKMTGNQLACEILAIKADMPVIICTGFSEKLNEQQAKSIGIKGLLMKPVAQSELAQTIRKVLDERKTRS